MNSCRTHCAAVVVALTFLVSTANADFINGNFQTGNLNGWTTYTTPNGTLGPPGLPDVQSFDTTGTGASLAAHFVVGNATLPNTGEQGGGLIQSLVLNPGLYSITGNIASVDSPAGPNVAAGLFSVLVDGVVQGSTDLGPFATQGQTLRGVLNATFVLNTAGTHEFRFQITRPFQGGNPAINPQQYLDNLTLTTVPEPSLATVALSSLCLCVCRSRRRRSIHFA
jgi:hypothetical protein